MVKTSGSRTYGRFSSPAEVDEVGRLWKFEIWVSTENPSAEDPPALSIGRIFHQKLHDARKFSLVGGVLRSDSRSIFPRRRPSSKESVPPMPLATKLLSQDRNHEIHNLIKASGFDGPPPTIAASSEVAMVPLASLSPPQGSADREDARKIWGFEQVWAGIPLTSGFR